MGHLDPKEPTTEIYAKIQRFRIVPEEGKVFGPSKKEIGCPDVHGHIICTVYVGSKQHKIRRSHLIWWGYYKSWPKTLVDHKDRVKTNDRIDNLRDRTHRGNMANKISHQNGLLAGVRRIGQTGKYQALVKNTFIGIDIGEYDTEIEANEAFSKVSSAIAEAIDEVKGNLHAILQRPER